MPTLFISAFTAFQLLATPASASNAASTAATVRVAQAAPQASAQVSSLPVAGRKSNAAAARLANAQKREAVLVREMAELRSTYNKQLVAVDKLKRSRASWRRDRKLRDQKARSQTTALALKSAEGQLRAQRQVVGKERKATARAIESELALSPSRVRTQYLRGLLASARLGLRSAPKKISMPDLELDEFADPEELLEQIALIERAEAKLAVQEASLDRRAKHYAHMDALRSKRDRAEALGAFDDDNVRRSTGRTSTGASRQDQDDATNGAGSGADLSSEPGAPPADSESVPDPSESGPDSSFEASSVVLSDVVDAGTQDALLRAHRSSSPRTKARAARRAHDQVQDRINRLKASKARIRAHLRRLSKQR